MELPEPWTTNGDESGLKADAVADNFFCSSLDVDAVTNGSSGGGAAPQKIDGGER